MFWHGSTALITRPYLLPGAVIGVPSRFGNGRNKTVFCSQNVGTAAGMGVPQWTERSNVPGFIYGRFHTAPFMYEVEPNGVYERTVTEPYSHMLNDEMMCESAVIVRAYRASAETQKPNTVAQLLATYELFDVIAPVVVTLPTPPKPKPHRRSPGARRSR